MSVWLCRSGRLGEHETKFLEDNKVYFTFEEVAVSMTSLGSKSSLRDYFNSIFRTSKSGAIQNWWSQACSFAYNMSCEDLVMMPSKIIPQLVYVGKIIGGYTFDSSAPETYRHSRSIDWFAKVPRAGFDQEIQAALRTPMTICKLKQEERIRKQVKSLSDSVTPPPEQMFDDFEANSLDSISNFIIQNFKGHGLADIVAGILRAKGFQVYVSPAGPDHGIDILASHGSLGFSSPKICVQVKATTDAIDRTVLDQLLGTMTNVGAEYGLLVSWGGFRQSIVRETAMQFFKVRLWTASDLLSELLENYDKLDDELKQRIPLKKIWILDSIE